MGSDGKLQRGYLTSTEGLHPYLEMIYKTIGDRSIKIAFSMGESIIKIII